MFQASVEVSGRWIGIRKFLVHCTTVASVGSWKGKSLACLAAWEENVASFHSATPEHFPAATSDMCLLLGSSLWYCQLRYHIFLWLTGTQACQARSWSWMMRAEDAEVFHSFLPRTQQPRVVELATSAESRPVWDEIPWAPSA